jgi:hypothetical protein
MRRDDLNVTELCNINWLLHFKQSPSEESMTPFEAKFKEDFSLYTDMHGRMNWQVEFARNLPSADANILLMNASEGILFISIVLDWFLHRFHAVLIH